MGMTTTTNTDPFAELTARTATYSDAQLIAALTVLDQIAKPTPDQRLVKATICEVLEARHPHVTAALDAWLDTDRPGTYAAALIAAL